MRVCGCKRGVVCCVRACVCWGGGGSLRVQADRGTYNGVFFSICWSSGVVGNVGALSLVNVAGQSNGLLYAAALGASLLGVVSFVLVRPLPGGGLASQADAGGGGGGGADVGPPHLADAGAPAGFIATIAQV